MQDISMECNYNGKNTCYCGRTSLTKHDMEITNGDSRQVQVQVLFLRKKTRKIVNFSVTCMGSSPLILFSILSQIMKPGRADNENGHNKGQIKVFISYS
jgi:hypothetical protein